MPYYLTTPIYYVNAEPHLGHLYTTVVADALARVPPPAGRGDPLPHRHRRARRKVAEAAVKAGLPVKAFVDRVSACFRHPGTNWTSATTTYIRTTDPAHVRFVQEVLQPGPRDRRHLLRRVRRPLLLRLRAPSTWSGTHRRPLPGPPDQAHRAQGRELLLPHEQVPGRLLDHINDNPDWIRPERYRNEVLAFLREPLEDLCISRPKTRLTWGITLPFDDRYVTYVWFDALLNYLSASGLPRRREPYQKFWPAHHLIAKDILKPHAIYWPTMLAAMGLEPFAHLNVHGYWQLDSGKMSKSLGNVVEPRALAAQYGVDQVRYFFLREMVFGLDAHFSDEALVARINADLANDLGNLLARSLGMAFKYRQGVVPASKRPQRPGPGSDSPGRKGRRRLSPPFSGPGILPGPGRPLGVHRPSQPLHRRLAPWELAKPPEAAARLDTVLYHLLESLRWIAALLRPVMPQSALKMSEQLGLGLALWDHPLPQVLQWGRLLPGGALQKGPALFPRIETEEK